MPMKSTGDVETVADVLPEAFVERDLALGLVNQFPGNISVFVLFEEARKHPAPVHAWRAPPGTPGTDRLP